MSLEINLAKIEKPNRFQNVPDQNQRYSNVTLMIPNVPVPAGAGAGLPVIMDFFNYGLEFKDTNYIVCAMNTSSQHLGFTVPVGVDKTTTGFRLYAYPGDAADTIAAGTCDVIVFYQD
jgi:hypothetical protein